MARIPRAEVYKYPILATLLARLCFMLHLIPSPQMVVMKDIPQQNNSSDCGMFSCKFAEYLSRRAEITFDQADMPYFRRRMMWEIVKNNILHP